MIAEIQTRETGLSSKFEEAAPTTAPIALVFPVAVALVDDPVPSGDGMASSPCWPQ